MTVSRASRLERKLPKKGRAGWTIGSKERKEFADFYAEDGGMGSARTGGSSSPDVRAHLHRAGQI